MSGQGVGVWSEVEMGVWSEGWVSDQRGVSGHGDPPQMAASTVGTHPNGMHSCL